MNRLPIRWRIAVWSALVSMGVALVFGAGTYAHVYQEQFEEAELELRGELARLAAEVEAGQSAGQGARVERSYHPRLSFAVFDPTGVFLQSGPGFDETAARAALDRSGRNLNARGEQWRIQVDKGARFVLVGAYNLEEVNEVLGDLLAVYFGLVPLVASLALAGGWALAGAGLAPVRRLIVFANQLHATDLSRRVDVPKTEDELRRLALVFNELIARLERAFLQAKRFSADASHELRTPLTILAAEVERLLHGREWSNEEEKALVSMQEEIARLNRITEHLLLLASVEAGATLMRRDPVDLSTLVRDAMEDAELLGEALGVRVMVEVKETVEVSGDAEHLRRLLLNLLQNAVRHNRPEGEVRCVLRREGAEAVLRLANTGPGISEEARGRLFERFYRGEVSRTARETHGLGLALAREIARAHGGDVTLSAAKEARPLGWVEFVLRLPMRAPPDERPKGSPVG